MVGFGRSSVPFLLLVLALLPSNCVLHSVGAASPLDPSTAIFIADDYGFEGPDTLPAGWTTVRLHNHGLEPHQIQLLKLTEGKTLADLSAALRDPEIAVPQWAQHRGGPNAVGSGGIAEARVYLDPGVYAIICVIPSKTGHPHVILGMTKALQVTEYSVLSQRFTNHYHVAMRDYEFVLIEPVTRGTHSFYVKNRGAQPHQISLVRLDPTVTTSDILAAFAPDSERPLPGTLVGGMTGLEPGADGSFTADLSEGRYAFICLFPNPGSASSHAAKGMVMNFAVK